MDNRSMKIRKGVLTDAKGIAKVHVDSGKQHMPILFQTHTGVSGGWYWKSTC